MKDLKSIFCGLVGSTILMIISIVIFSLILAKTNFNEKYIDTTIIVIYGVCIFIGTAISTKKIEKRGALIGATMATLYFITLYIGSSIFTGDFSINIASICMLVVSIVLGSIGGIIGVNIK